MAPSAMDSRLVSNLALEAARLPWAQRTQWRAARSTKFRPYSCRAVDGARGLRLAETQKDSRTGPISVHPNQLQTFRLWQR
jgi:hypothetical protein